MRAALDRIFRRFVVSGRLTIHWPDGQVSSHGTGEGPTAGLALRDTRLLAGLLLQPDITIGEAYMDGRIAPVDGTIYDVLDVLMSNYSAGAAPHRLLALQEFLGRVTRWIRQFNPAARARRNIARHYDLNGRLYSLFLDRDRQYSCAYFRTGTETLEQAQIAKKHHIAAKLKLDRPDLSVLDIGSGWGGMALTLARDYGARVTGITLSSEQLAEARARASAEGLQERVGFELCDYRAMTRRFDRIVSVGMFEHVGVVHYRQYFEAIRRCLAPDGVALLHAIGRPDGPGRTNPWIARYIFPGGYIPALSEVLPAIEKAGLVVTDIEILRLHYAETLRHWRRRFAANRDTIAALYDERFCRMFEFYLAGAELAFRRHGQMVFQIQITRDQGALPLTRDYMFEAERVMAPRVSA
ncbi:Class I SAM-dependent methyltransferase [Rhodovastum atsumiense]|uniref:Class I SAM-dependent methyltransferase n=1 Tax=Rhodovastum atsumiense TaxID=504468 RepID=A0A5M6IW91_9PROT|nr:cyclopropane-fatty-acyl-phospholipid synthase family protein [Rhodovastum atsumiense]KAA5612239.1 class I SAM-dependent methyltransferase [Rhodovastum atsumiense]CAH2601561.1 Class I SAM-dependent methyltransferase [Rhodovastum atsumiense]